MAEHIASRENEAVKRACKLRDSAAYRQSENCFLAEGARLCLDLASVLTPREVYYTEAALAARPALAQLPGAHALVSESVAQKMADTRTPQGVFCVFERRAGALADIVPGARWLVLEHVQDPANVGALLRSAAAFGFAGAVLCANCADPWGPKAVRASMGCAAKLALVFCASVPLAAQAFRAAGIPLVAAALRRSVPLSAAGTAPDKGLALLIGNEGGGLTDEAVDAADTVVRIPMAPGVESLNAAVAGGVLLWHFRGAAE